MANDLVIPKDYADGDILFEADLDAIRNAVQDFLNTTGINDDNIQSGGVGTASLANLSVTLGKMAAVSVDENKLTTSVAGNGLTGGAGTALSVNVDGSTLEINTDALRVKDAGITKPKLAALGQQTSSSSGSFSTTSGTFVDVTNLSVTITTSGRPVMCIVQGDNTGTGGFMGAATNNILGTLAQAYFQVLRDSTVVSNWFVEIEATGNGSGNILIIEQPANLICIDTPGAGTYTYKVQAKFAFGTGTGAGAALKNAVLVAFEL